MKSKLILAVIVLSSSIFYSCQKDASENESGTSSLRVRMTDAPLAVEEVNIDLRSVQVKLRNDSAEFQTLQTTAGIYNLLSFQNGIDTLIGQGVVPVGMVKEIRLILGDSNTIKVDGQVFPLRIPSGSESGLKIKVDKRLQATLETILIDFDAALSVKKEQDGYKLRPVIKLK